MRLPISPPRAEGLPLYAGVPFPQVGGIGTDMERLGWQALNCLYCDRPLKLITKRKNRFCSDVHRSLCLVEFWVLGLERLGAPAIKPQGKRTEREKEALMLWVEFLAHSGNLPDHAGSRLT